MVGIALGSNLCIVVVGELDPPGKLLILGYSCSVSSSLLNSHSTHTQSCVRADPERLHLQEGPDQSQRIQALAGMAYSPASMWHSNSRPLPQPTEGGDAESAQPFSPHHLVELSAITPSSVDSTGSEVKAFAEQLKPYPPTTVVCVTMSGLKPLVQCFRVCLQTEEGEQINYA